MRIKCNEIYFPVTRVLRTKSATSLPITLCSANMLNELLWVAFGIIDGDFYVLTPNVTDFVLSVAQVSSTILTTIRKSLVRRSCCQLNEMTFEWMCIVCYTLNVRGLLLFTQVKR